MDTIISGKMSRKSHRMKLTTDKAMMETILLVRDPQRVDVTDGGYEPFKQTSSRDSIRTSTIVINTGKRLSENPPAQRDYLYILQHVRPKQNECRPVWTACLLIYCYFHARLMTQFLCYWASYNLLNFLEHPMGAQIPFSFQYAAQ